MATHPKYELKRSSNQQFYWNLSAKNGQTILTSEMYVSKQGAENGIESVRSNSTNDKNYQRSTTGNDQYFFNLNASNKQVIGRSETYTSETARENGIESVKENGPIAEVEDNT